MLFDDSKRFYDQAKKAGNDISLQTWDDSIHGFHRSVNSGKTLPESIEALEKIRKFVDKLRES